MPCCRLLLDETLYTVHPRRTSRVPQIRANGFAATVPSVARCFPHSPPLNRALGIGNFFFFVSFLLVRQPPEHPSDCQGGETVKHSRVRQTIQSVCPPGYHRNTIAPYPQEQKQKQKAPKNGIYTQYSYMFCIVSQPDRAGRSVGGCILQLPVARLEDGYLVVIE